MSRMSTTWEYRVVWIEPGETYSDQGWEPVSGYCYGYYSSSAPAYGGGTHIRHFVLLRREVFMGERVP